MTTKIINKIKKSLNLFLYLLLIISAIVIIIPVAFIVLNSFMGKSEILNSYSGVFSGGLIDLHLIPYNFSLKGYFTVFFSTPTYLVKFWNSIFIAVAIVAGQTVISCISGYGFSKFYFPFKNVFVYLLIILMILPNQVTLVSNYIVLEKMGLIGSYAAVILPGIFSAFGVFLLIQVFSSIPDNLIEAARIEGANHFKILYKIVIPYGKSGIASLVILCFIDNWNMVEQPLIFLKDSRKYPLSIFLSNINQNDLGIAFICGILAIIPVLLLFLFLKESLVFGIENANLK